MRSKPKASRTPVARYNLIHVFLLTGVSKQIIQSSYPKNKEEKKRERERKIISERKKREIKVILSLVFVRLEIECGVSKSRSFRHVASGRKGASVFVFADGTTWMR